MMKKTTMSLVLPFALSASALAAGSADATPRAASGMASGAGESASKDDDGARQVKGRNEVEGEITGTPAKGSPFANLEIGMAQDDVNDRIGSGQDCGAYQTGKQWIPFRFSSNDTIRSECNYKGAGRLIYTKNKRGSFLLKIINDASEDGVRD